MARRPKNIVAVTPSGNITMEMILGFYTLVQVPNAPVSAAKLHRLWVMEGLEERLVPQERRAVDVFMRACRSVETRREDSDRVREIKVDRVLEAPEECVYQITLMVRDKDHRVIEHPKAMRIVYSDGNIIDEALDDKKLYKEMRSLADDIRDHFDKNSTKVPGAKVRAAIRSTLDEHHATRIQNKGVFFVPKPGKPALDSIQHILDKLYSESRMAELHLIPCANDEGERAMVARHFSANVADEIDGLLAEVSQRLKSEVPVRKDRKASLVGQRKRIGVAVEHYRDLLDTNIDLVDEKIRLLNDGLEELLID